MDEFLQKLALVTVLEIHFLKALVCACERALFCTLNQETPPPDRELFTLGPETFRRHRRRGCHAWPAVSPVGWELRGQTCGGSGLCGSAPWQGPLQWLVQRQARVSEMASQRSRGQAGQELRAVSGWLCWVFFLLGSSIQLCGFELALPLQKKARGDTEERTSPVARLPSLAPLPRSQPTLPICFRLGWCLIMFLSEGRSDTRRVTVTLLFATEHLSSFIRMIKSDVDVL